MLARWQARGRALGLALALCFAASAPQARAQTATWSSRGPTGGNIHCLAADPSHPSTLYAGTDQGVFKSSDAGASWQPASAGIPPNRVQTIAIDPTAPSTLYAGTITPAGAESVGIFKSTDAGASWVPINSGLIDPSFGIAPLDVEALAIDPRNSSTLLAGTVNSEIFKSTDAGATWQPKTFGGAQLGLQTSAFVFGASGSSTVYAAGTLGLLRSADGGETWFQYGNAGITFYALVADPTNPATLYGGNADGFGISKSTDGGAHWTSVNKGLPVDQDSAGSFSPLTIALAVDPSRPSTVYAGTFGNGFFQSADGAANWTAAGSGMRVAYTAAISLGPGPSPSLYAGTLGGGVYESHDSAATWTPSNTGLDLSLIYELRADPASPATLYAAAADGVQKSADGGASWQASSNGLPVDAVAAIMAVPGPGSALLAGTLGGGLFKSADGGASWAGSAAGLTDSYIAAIAFDPTSPSTLYAGTAHPDTSQSERVFKSTDGGGTWAQTGLDAKTAAIGYIVVNAAKPAQVIAVSQGAIGYFQSLDAGKTWSTISTDPVCGGVYGILFDPSGSTLYLAGGGGVCKSGDGGKTWTVAPVASLAVVQVLLMDPSSPSTLYAGAAPAVIGGTGGVFRSTDAGATWQVLGSGLSDATVNALALDPQGQMLHAGTFGRGVFELSLARDRQTVRPLAPAGPPPRSLPPR